MEPLAVVRYELSDAEIAALDSLISELEASGHDPASPPFHDEAWSFVPHLPPGLQRLLARFRLDETAAACHIAGYPVDDLRLGPTPASLHDARELGAGAREEFFIGLVAMCLGDVFNWATLQNGRLIHDVMPIRGEETAQSGHGSKTLLEWHVEDAFHPHRADYLLLMGLRNPGTVSTIVSSIRGIPIPADDARILGERRFHILPDDEHIHQLAKSFPLHPGLARMRSMREDPPLVSVLFGASDEPYIRIDPVYMRCQDGDDEAEEALGRLVHQIASAQVDVVVDPGDILILDNFLAVHGRRPFAAQYDGRDRWLKKTLVTRDLRKSRDSRSSPNARVLA
jgi:Fe(II)/alpha-ketoglutarate-dependent arginine beta-hydroxylase